MVDEMNLSPFDGRTLLSVVITHPKRDHRDRLLVTGMMDGMEDRQPGSLTPVAVA